MEIYNLLVNQYLLPECLNAVKYPAFWESTDEPSLKKFLDFRLSADNLEDMKTENNRYNNELNEISKFYTEVSEIMSTSTTLQPVALVVGMTACLLMSYTQWDLGTIVLAKDSYSIIEYNLDKRQNIVMRNELIEDKTNLQEEKARMKIAQHITIATVATEQIQEYAMSTTTCIAERFLDNSNERTSKRTRTYKDSNDADVNEDNPFWAPVTESGYLDVVQNEENGAEILFHSPRNYNEDAIFLTPNKRQMNNGRIVQYLDAMRKLLKYDQVVVQRPPVWTESLNTYIDNVLKKTGNNFKSEIIQKIDGDENNMFRLYSTIWSIYFQICQEKLENETSKLTKTIANSVIVKVDIRVGTSENRQAQNAKVVVRRITGYLSDIEIWNNHNI
nr:6227_t:CDS:10 [Entrophospora candida]